MQKQSTNKPLISVLLPVYNGEKYLSKSIESILNQQQTDFEFIIINDGSTDNTESIILSYDDDRIIYIKNENNLKIIKSLNKGIMVAKGLYISRMDADDIAFPNLFERQLEVFNRLNYVDIVNIRSFIMSDDGLTFRRSNTVITVNYDVHQHIVFFQNMISHPGVMIKSLLLKKYKYYDHESVTHFEDIDLWYKLLKDGSYCHTIDECLLFYRNTKLGINNTQRISRINRGMKYCKKILDIDYLPFFEDKTIKIILGKYELINFKELFKLANSLTKYIIFIKENKNISITGLNDLIYWKTHLLFVISIMLLRQQKLFFKIGTIFYLSLSLPLWLTNKKWRKNFMQVIFNKKIRIQ